MKTRMVLFGMILFTAGLLIVGENAAQETKGEKRKSLTELAKEAMEKAWAEASTPGEEHQYLARMEGSWNYTGKIWMNPGTPPMETSGTSENMMILGGRFLQQEASGTYQGQEFNGFGLTGFDNVSKKFQSVWVDNMGTMMVTMTGTRGPEGKVLTTFGEYKDISKGALQKFKTVTTIKGKDEILYEWFNVSPQNEEMKTMELIYKRK